MFGELLSLDTVLLKNHIANYHNLLDLPVKDVTAENILARWLSDNGCKIIWNQGSHGRGSDIFIIKDRRLGISVKSAKQPQKGKGLQISSYRTESWPTLLEKVDGIREVEKEIQSYVIFARTEIKRNDCKLVNYNVYILSPDLLAIDSFKMSDPDVKGNYTGSNELGVKIAVVKTMSSQIWYTVPMALVKDGGEIIKRICEVGPFEMRLWNVS